MKKITNPVWLLLVSVPQVLIFVLYYATYKIIASQLSADVIHTWVALGCYLAVALAGTILYTGVCVILRQPVNRAISVILAIVYTGFLWFYFTNIDTIIPSDIPRWMLVRGDVEVYGFTFILPVLIYCIFLFVSWITPEREMRHGWHSLLYAIFIPVAWFIGVTVVVRGLDLFDNHFAEMLLVLLLIISVFAFLVFLLRFFYVLMWNRSSLILTWRLLWQIPVYIVLPVVGLCINNSSYNYVFGNFSSYWFYAIAIVNGFVLCLPRQGNKYYRLALFVVSAVTFSYITYFFLVFLPYLPLSIIFIILIGLGFLMLAPLIIFFMQAQVLYRDYVELRASFHPALLSIIFIVSYFLIPAFVTASYLYDRLTIHEALACIYHPDYAKLEKQGSGINQDRLKAVIKEVETVKRNTRPEMFSNDGQPYLGSLYNWLVLDNMVLSDDKISLLKQVFLNEQAGEDKRIHATGDKDVVIEQLNTNTTYDSIAKCYRTMVVLNLRNKGTSNLQYQGCIRLPEGVYISNYYLVMNGKKEYGLLAEKKAAQWVYNSIVNYRKDPGIMYYTAAGQVELNVFPVPQYGAAETGFEVIHGTPGITVNTSGNTINVSVNNIGENRSDTPKYYCHFLVDRSATGKINNKRIKEITNEVLSNMPNNNRNDALISFVNYDHTTVPISSDWQQKDIPAKGGFFVDPVIRTELGKKYGQVNTPVPVFFVISDGATPLFRRDFMDIDFALPVKSWFAVSAEGAICKHSFATAQCDNILIEEKQLATVVEHELKPAATHATNLSQNYMALFNDPGRKDLLLRAQTVSNCSEYMVLHPEQNDRLWLPLLKESFSINVLSPATSFISLENEAEKNALKAKQDQVLNAKNYLDTGEEKLDPMSEPPLWLMTLFALFIAALWNKRNRLTRYASAT